MARKRMASVLIFLVLFALAGCGHPTFTLGHVGQSRTITKTQHNIKVSLDVKRVKDGVSFTESIENTSNRTVTVTYNQPLSEINIDSKNNNVSRTLPAQTTHSTSHQIKLQPHETYGQNFVMLPKGTYYVTAMFFLEADGKHLNIPLNFDLKLR